MSSNNNNNDGEAFTHPQLYREYINHPPNANNNKNSKNEPKKMAETINNGSDKIHKRSSSNSEDEWDLYPKIIRDIENHGSPEQIEHLHQLEKTPSRH